MANNFSRRMRHVTPGDPVAAGVTSSPTRTLEARTIYLKEVLDSIEAGRALLHRDVSVDPALLPGQPAFWNAETQRYEPALAAVENDLAVNGLSIKPSTDVVGLLLHKYAGNRGDIAIYGMVKFSDFSAAIDGAIVPGRYYLSAVEPGKLVLQRPPVTVAVCVVLGPMDACDQNTWVLVLPQMRDFLEDHVHYQVKLKAAPAGCASVPDPGMPHVIELPDPTIRGWLPADHAIFEGRAPAGAAFGYNLAAHDELSRVWPPIPITAAILEQFKPGDGVRVGGRVPDSKIKFTPYGIWWMTDCYGEAPWPTNLVSCDSSSSSSASSESAADCPFDGPMELILSFIKMTFATNKTVVTSLQPDEGQPLRFVDCDGKDATVGDLFARLNLTLLLDDRESYGGTVLKGITDTNKFKWGWVCEGLIAGSENISLTGTRRRRRSATDSRYVYQGLVTVDVNLDPIDRELTPVLVRLGDALERVHKNIPYIALPNSRDSSIRLRFNIPPTGLPDSPQMLIRVELFGMLTGTMTDLSMSYYKLARANGGPVPIVAGDTPLTFNTAIAVTAEEANEIESSSFAVTAGDTVYVSITRLAAGLPAYNSEIGLLRVTGIILAET